MLRRSAPVPGRSNFRSAVSCEIIKVFFGRALLRPRAGALRILKTLIILVMAILPLLSSAVENQECVILLHGLCRTSRSMVPMERALLKTGYHVLNVDYPSRTASIEKLSEDAISRAVADCSKVGATKIHFVTHSLGGILVRSYLSRHAIPNLGRAVMLGPPNQGSEVVDKLGSWWAFQKLNGPAGKELGTDKNSTPNKIGPANFCAGVIAGDRSINWINSLLIPGRDDGKVSIERTKLAGMTDHIVIHAAHPFLMRNRTAIRQTIYFLHTGRFERVSTRQIEKTG
jgi:pimeloyl-ACP methyl ester carboxylesterase